MLSTVLETHLYGEPCVKLIIKEYQTQEAFLGLPWVWIRTFGPRELHFVFAIFSGNYYP